MIISFVIYGLEILKEPVKGFLNKLMFATLK